MIKISGIDYSLETFDEDKNFVGKVDYYKQKIQVMECEEDYMYQSLWHEIIHAVLTNEGYDELSADEQFVQSLASSIHQVVKDNPNLEGELYGEEKES